MRKARRFRARYLTALVALALLGSCRSKSDNEKADETPPPVAQPETGPPAVDTEPARFTFENGLRVMVEPLPAAGDKVALIVLFEIGSDHDPAGSSGLAHMVEHLYLTAAAGDTAARSVQDFVRKYAAGWNAQTGARYTVVATVFAKADLEAELRDAAARMGDLRITDADLAREKPRLVGELHNMFAGIPELAAANLAREAVRPTPGGGRKGGLPEVVESFTADQVTAFWRRYYKPANALLVIAGAIDGETARVAIDRHFGALPTGDKAPSVAAPGLPKKLAQKTQTVTSPGTGHSAEACLAHRAPEPNSDDYATFLVVLGRMTRSARILGPQGPRFPVRYAPLDQPEVVFVCTAPRQKETPAQVTKRLDDFVAAALKETATPGDAGFVAAAYGSMLGLQPLPPHMARRNLYGVAFAHGRREQLGIDPEALRTALQKVSDESVRRVGTEYLSRDKRAAVVVTPAIQTQ